MKSDNKVTLRLTWIFVYTFGLNFSDWYILIDFIIKINVLCFYEIMEHMSRRKKSTRRGSDWLLYRNLSRTFRLPFGYAYELGIAVFCQSTDLNNWNGFHDIVLSGDFRVLCWCCCHMAMMALGPNTRLRAWSVSSKWPTHMKKALILIILTSKFCGRLPQPRNGWYLSCNDLLWKISINQFFINN